MAGFAKELLDPRPADIAGHQLHLGGYGILPTRPTTGPLVDGDGTVEHIYARAMAVTNRQGQTILLAALENQPRWMLGNRGRSSALRCTHLDIAIVKGTSITRH